MEQKNTLEENKTHFTKVHWNSLHKFLFIFSCILICSIGFVATDLYLPSLPAIAEFFQKDAASVQLTMSIFLITMAVFQIFSGFLSDHYGRKKILALSMMIFILASLGCACSQSLNELVFFRFLQAIGACGGLSIGQALVADFFDSRETARLLSIIIPLVAFSPAIAPVLGGHIDLHFGWQKVFLLLMAYGIFILIILSTTIIPNSEIKNQEKNSAPFQMRFFWEIIFNKNFLGYASFMMASNATYFSFVATAPFLFKKFGYSGPMVGYSLCAASFPYMFSSFLGRKLSLQRTNLQIIFIGITLNVLGGLVLTSLFFLNWQHLLALMIPVFIITIGNGLLMPFCSANAIALFPQSAGLVTGILGAAQLAASAVATALMGIFENGTLLPFTLLVLGVSGYALTYFLSHFGHQNALSLKKK